MQSASLSRAQVIGITLVFSLIFVLLSMAAWSRHDPGECKIFAGSERSSLQQPGEESLWCPATWTPTTVFTGALVVVTGGLWVFTALLWFTTKQSLDGAKAVGEAAIITAGAALRQAEIAERTLIGLERPYLFVQVKNINRNKELDANFEQVVADIVYHNHGKIPAVVKSVTTRIICQSEQNNMIDVYRRIGGGLSRPEAVEFVIESSKSYKVEPIVPTVWFEPEVTGDHVTDTMAKIDAWRRYYIYGQILYTSPFQGMEPYITRFVYRLREGVEAVEVELFTQQSGEEAYNLRT